MGSNNKTLFIAVAAVLIFAAFWIGRRNPLVPSAPVSVPSSSTTPFAPVETIPPLESSQNPNPPHPTQPKPVEPPSASAPVKKNFQQALKDMKLATIAQARKEVRENPHATPSSVIKSAIQLGETYDAVTSESDARAFMEHLEKCAEGKSEQTNTIRSTCIQYSERLAETYPDLRAQAERIRGSSTAEARELLDISRQFLKGNPNLKK